MLELRKICVFVIFFLLAFGGGNWFDLSCYADKGEIKSAQKKENKTVEKKEQAKEASLEILKNLKSQNEAALDGLVSNENRLIALFSQKDKQKAKKLLVRYAMLMAKTETVSKIITSIKDEDVKVISVVHTETTRSKEGVASDTREDYNVSMRAMSDGKQIDFSIKFDVDWFFMDITPEKVPLFGSLFSQYKNFCSNEGKNFKKVSSFELFINAITSKP